MPNERTDTLPEPTGEEERAAPLAGTRSQSMQRLQVGLFGLSAMIVLVGLANVITKRANESDARVVPEAAATVGAGSAPTQASDPLADAGVVPDIPTAIPPRTEVRPPSPATDDEPPAR